MMNMQKVGMLEQSKQRCKNGSESGSNLMNTGMQGIHYA
jgi:hypothetical protein